MISLEYNPQGKLIGYKFEPTATMIYVGKERSKPENLKKTLKKFFKDIDVALINYEMWKQRYNVDKKHPIYVAELGEVKAFDNWWNETLDTYLRDIKDVLYHIGLVKAKAGNYQYWRDMVKITGLMPNETIDHNVKQLTVNIKDYEHLSPEEIRAAEKELLGALAPNPKQGGSAVESEVVRRLPEDKKS